MGSLFQTLIVALSESGLGCPAHVYNGWKLKEAGLYINSSTRTYASYVVSQM